MKKLLSVLVVAVAVCWAGVVMANDSVIIRPPDRTTPIVGPIVPYSLSAGTINITEGWNLIAIPVVPQTPLTVSGFMNLVSVGDNIIDLTGVRDIRMPPVQICPSWNVSVVAVYKNGRFKTYTQETGTYNMVPGEAYFVHAEYNGPRIRRMPPDILTTTVQITGKPVNASVSLNLNKGWNGVALMMRKAHSKPLPLIGPLDGPFDVYDPPTMITRQTDDSTSVYNPIPIYGYPFDTEINIMSSLSQLSKELSEQGIQAKRIAFWDAKNQQWEQHELPYDGQINPPMGFGDTALQSLDRIIMGSEGFFLLSSENGLYLPGLDLSQKLSDPSIPPLPLIPPVPEVIIRYDESSKN